MVSYTSQFLFRNSCILYHIYIYIYIYISYKHAFDIFSGVRGTTAKVCMLAHVFSEVSLPYLRVTAAKLLEKVEKWGRYVCICMCVCMYMCMYICMNTYVCARMFVCVLMCTYIYNEGTKCLHTNTIWTHTHTHSCMHACIHTYTYIHTYRSMRAEGATEYVKRVEHDRVVTQVYIYVYTHIYIYIYIYI